jgi:hypothetical protein
LGERVEEVMEERDAVADSMLAVECVDGVELELVLKV